MAARHPPHELLAAAIKYGPSVDHVAAQYTNPLTGKRLSGAALLLKDALGENGWGNKGVSSAGARGFTQFIPSTRREYIQKYGIDPWRSADEAIHATAIYFKNAGNIASYNPGMPSYTHYILDQHIGNVLAGQKVAQRSGGHAPAAALGAAPSAAPAPAQGSQGTGLEQLLAEITGQRKSQLQVGALQAPAFAAHATLPARFSPTSGGWSPPAASGVDAGSLVAAIGAGGSSGSTPTGTGRVAAPAGPGHTLVVGDSLGVGTSPRLKQLLGGRLDVNAVVGRSSTASVAAARRALASGRYGSVVLDFGTNDSSAGELAQSIRQVAQLAPSTQILIPTLNGPGAAQKNAVLHRVEAALPNVRLVPWHSQSGGLLGPDGIHATAGGYDRRAQLVATALGVRPARAPQQAGGRRVPIGAHGGWGGSEGPAYALYQTFGKPLGLSVASTKRNNTNPYSGKGSDHDFSQRQSFAIDASNGGSPTPQMDQYAYDLMHALGFKGYRKGTPINVSQGVKTINGVRFQVIYRGSGRDFGGNHLNHVHLGVRHVG